MNKYWIAGIFVASLIAGFVSGWYVNGNRLGKQIAEIQQAHTEEQAKIAEQVRLKEQSYRNEMEQQAEQYQSTRATTTKTIEKLQLELKNVQKKNPMPDTCKLDAGRLSVIKQAGNSANGTGAGSR